MTRLDVAVLAGLFALLPQASAREERMPVRSQEVLTFLHHADAIEIALGQLALQTSGSPSIREFASRLIKDHTKADRMVLKAAAADHMSVSSKPVTTDETNVMIFLRNLSGSKFDLAFANQIDADHKIAIDTLEGDLSSLPVSSNTGALVRTLLPTLSEDRANALTIAAQLSAIPEAEREPASP